MPVLGKLVCMARIRFTLDRESSEVGSRLTEALAQADTMLVWYRRYAAGLILRAQLRSIREFAIVWGRKEADSTAESAIEGDLGTAAAVDQDLIRFVRLSTSKLPRELVERLNDVRAKKQTERGDQVMRPAQDSLASYATQLLRLAGPLLGSGPIARAEVERQLVRKIRRDLKEGDIMKSIVDARIVDTRGGLDPTRRFENFMTVADNAGVGGYWAVAEVWVKEAIGTAAAPGSSIEPGRLERAKEFANKIMRQPLSRLISVF